MCFSGGRWSNTSVKLAIISQTNVAPVLFKQTRSPETLNGTIELQVLLDGRHHLDTRRAKTVESAFTLYECNEAVNCVLKAVYVCDDKNDAIDQKPSANEVQTVVCVSGMSSWKLITDGALYIIIYF